MIGFSVAAQRLHEERVVQSGGAVGDFPGASYAPAAPVDAERFDRVSAAAAASTGTSPATAARRRQVFTVLGGLTVIFFLVGIIPYPVGPRIADTWMHRCIRGPVDPLSPPGS
jgi:hypothetical protein